MPTSRQIHQAFDRAVISTVALDDASALEAKLTLAARTMCDRDGWLKPHQRRGILLRAAALLEARKAHFSRLTHAKAASR